MASPHPKVDALGAAARYRRKSAHKAVVGSVLERLRRVPPRKIDTVLATSFVVGGLLSTAPSATNELIHERSGALATALLLASTVPYYAAPRPAGVFAVTATAVAALAVLGYNIGALAARGAPGRRERLLLKDALPVELLAGTPWWPAATRSSRRATRVD